MPISTAEGHVSDDTVVRAARTPRPIIQRLNSEINPILKDSDVKRALNVQGFDVIGGPREDLAKLSAASRRSGARLIRRTGREAVVDARLRVRGLEELRVCDALIMPTMAGRTRTRRPS